MYIKQHIAYIYVVNEHHSTVINRKHSSLNGTLYKHRDAYTAHIFLQVLSLVLFIYQSLYHLHFLLLCTCTSLRNNSLTVCKHEINSYSLSQ